MCSIERVIRGKEREKKKKKEGRREGRTEGSTQDVIAYVTSTRLRFTASRCSECYRSRRKNRTVKEDSATASTPSRTHPALSNTTSASRSSGRTLQTEHVYSRPSARVKLSARTKANPAPRTSPLSTDGWMSAGREPGAPVSKQYLSLPLLALSMTM